jgi:hypothetical protein
MEIKPIYVTFEQATKLSELKADLRSNRNQWLLAKDKGDMSKSFICDSDELESYTQIDEDIEHNVYHCLSIPEQWQVVEWLWVNHGIWISVNKDTNYVWANNYFNYQIISKDKGCAFSDIGGTIPNTPQEAYSAAFDYILKELI